MKVSDSPIKIPRKYIKQLHINKMDGRLLHLPAKKKGQKKFIVVYGHHSSLERMYALAEYLNDFGEVIIPDLPGFGGMDSFFSIGEEPTIENYADYLHTIIKLHCKNSKYTLVGMSFGFLISTRMILKYPSMTKEINDYVSMMGWGQHTDFDISPAKMKLYLFLTKTAKNIYISAVVRHLLFSGPGVRWMLKRHLKNNPKYAGVSEKNKADTIQMETVLWHINDASTWFFTLHEMFTKSLLEYTNKPIDKTLHNMHSKADQWFKSKEVKKSLDKLFKKHDEHLADMDAHGPSVVGDKSEIEAIIPKGIKKLL